MTGNDDLLRVYRDDMTYPDDWDDRSSECQDAWAAAWRSAALKIVERDERIATLEASLILHKACSNGMALNALRALITELDALNDQNPWLGVTAGVALLKHRIRDLEKERDALKNVLGEIATTTIGTGSLDDALAMLRDRRDKASRATGINVQDAPPSTWAATPLQAEERDAMVEMVDREVDERIVGLEEELESERFKHDIDHELVDRLRNDLKALRTVAQDLIDATPIASMTQYSIARVPGGPWMRLREALDRQYAQEPGADGPLIR